MKIISQLQRGYKKLEIFISLYQFLLIGQVYAMTYSGELYYRIIISLIHYYFFDEDVKNGHHRRCFFCLSINFFCDVISYLWGTTY